MRSPIKAILVFASCFFSVLAFAMYENGSGDQLREACPHFVGELEETWASKWCEECLDDMQVGGFNLEDVNFESAKFDDVRFHNTNFQGAHFGNDRFFNFQKNPFSSPKS